MISQYKSNVHKSREYTNSYLIYNCNTNACVFCLNFMEILAQYLLYLYASGPICHFWYDWSQKSFNQQDDDIKTVDRLQQAVETAQVYLYRYICTYKNKTIKLRFPISITFILLVIVTQNVEYGMQKSIAMVLSKTSFKRSKKYTVRFCLLQFLPCSKICILVLVLHN